MNNEKKAKIRENLSLLEGLKVAIDECKYNACSITIANDYNRIVSEVCKVIGKDVSPFLIPSNHINVERKTCNVEAAKSKVNQMINLLKTIKDSESDERVKLKEFLDRIKAIRDSIKDIQEGQYDELIGRDFNRITNEICRLIDREPSEYLIPIETSKLGIVWCERQVSKSKINQMISILEHILNPGKEVNNFGNLLKTIKDKDLRERCLDLLTLEGNFDRVINQATLVLEDRIRKKSGIVEKAVGADLVNKVLNADPTKTILKVSDDENEQRGFCDICRGLMLAFRNPTHHHLTDKFSMKDALKLCAFIDLLLDMVNSSEKIR